MVCNIHLFRKSWKEKLKEEVNRDIFGRQEQGGGLGKIWNGRKLRKVG
jgi:hypothetical protein